MHFVSVDMYQPTLCPICQWHSFLPPFNIAMIRNINLKIKRDDPEMGISHVNCGNVVLCIVGELLTEFGNPWSTLVQNFSHATPLM